MLERMITLLAGVVLDWMLGDPESPAHPVCLIGTGISRMEKLIRSRMSRLRLGGVLLLLCVTGFTVLAVLLLTALFSLFGRPGRFFCGSLLTWLGLSARTMVDEARQVERALHQGLEPARRQVGRIVGRDTQSLSEKEIICATVETVAENTTDGVISPMFYALLGGPAALWAFKAVSTLDSMVGYRNERYRELGWASARLDDVLNYIPARITALLMCLSALLTGMDAGEAFRTVLRDHDKHLSPNSAWSEAAAAGALHLQLGGTHSYFGQPVSKPTIGRGGHSPERRDIRLVCRLLALTQLLFLPGMAVVIRLI